VHSRLADKNKLAKTAKINRDFFMAYDFLVLYFDEAKSNWLSAI
jgi:hypothetical protein